MGVGLPTEYHGAPEPQQVVQVVGLQSQGLYAKCKRWRAFSTYLVRKHRWLAIGINMYRSEFANLNQEQLVEECCKLKEMVSVVTAAAPYHCQLLDIC